MKYVYVPYDSNQQKEDYQQVLLVAKTLNQRVNRLQKNKPAILSPDTTGSYKLDNLAAPDSMLYVTAHGNPRGIGTLINPSITPRDLAKQIDGAFPDKLVFNHIKIFACNSAFSYEGEQSFIAHFSAEMKKLGREVKCISGYIGYVGEMEMRKPKHSYAKASCEENNSRKCRASQSRVTLFSDGSVRAAQRHLKVEINDVEQEFSAISPERALPSCSG